MLSIVGYRAANGSRISRAVPRLGARRQLRLELIYAHLNSTTTVGSMPAEIAEGNFSAPEQWGKLIRAAGNGRPSLYERDFGGGHKVFTFVFWAE